MNATLLAFAVAALCAAAVGLAYHELKRYCQLHPTRDHDEEFP